MSKRNWNHVPDKALLDVIKKELIRLNTKSSVTYQEKRDRLLPSNSYLIKRFGGWNTMLEKAGLKPTKKHYTDEELLNMLRRYAEEHGHAPSAHEPSLPSDSVFIRHFESWANALRAAGLEPLKPRRSKEEIESFVKNWVKSFVKEKGRVPSIQDWVNDPSVNMSIDNVMSRLGKHWTELWREIGFEPPHYADYKVDKVKASDEELIDMYRGLCHKLKRTATVGDMERERKERGFYTPYVFIHRFGSLYRLRELAGVEQLHSRNKYTDEEIKSELVKAFQRTGRVKAKEFEKELPFILNTAYRRLGIYNIQELYDYIEQNLPK